MCTTRMHSTFRWNLSTVLAYSRIRVACLCTRTSHCQALRGDHYVATHWVPTTRVSAHITMRHLPDNRHHCRLGHHPCPATRTHCRQHLGRVLRGKAYDTNANSKMHAGAGRQVKHCSLRVGLHILQPTNRPPAILCRPQRKSAGSSRIHHSMLLKEPTKECFALHCSNTPAGP